MSKDSNARSINARNEFSGCILFHERRLQSVFLQLQEKKLSVAIGVILLLVLLSILLLSRSQQKGETKPQPSKLSQQSAPSAKPSPLPPPKVFFETYENKSSLPTVPETVNGYTLKTNYTLAEVIAFGKKLGLTEVKTPDDKFVILYNLTDMNNRGILTFNRETGGISFQSYGVHKAKDSWDGGPAQRGLLPGVRKQVDVEGSTQRFLSNLGILDPTIVCPITYQKKGLEQITFVECHRDWKKVELPILNAIGVLNIPENKPLASLAVGQTDENTPADPSIISVSIAPPSQEPIRSPGRRDLGQDGKARPNDFNTITVGVTPDGRILSIESNLRAIKETRSSIPRQSCSHVPYSWNSRTNYRLQSQIY
ncbi:hypothetical protein HY008_02855 [Candidatus Woesebacteria bacterium]|nr:hypothetical protein [Candidatus Woesebacteria bacterium]